MIRNVAGVFGPGAGEARSAVSRALEPDVSGEYTTSSLALAWSGEPPAPSPRTLLFAGRLQNLRSLGAELGRPDDLDDASAVASAFERWGTAALERLRGGFAVVLWDPETREGILAVDQLGVGGLFLHESRGRLSFATEVRDLVRLLPSGPAPAAASVVQWLADGHLRVGDTLLEGVRRLRGGHVVHLKGESWHTSEYWSPRYRPHDELTVAEATAELEAELARSVRERMARDGTTGVLLSGGIDSSTVAALASRLDPPAGPLRAFSHVYPEHPDLDESGLAELVATALAIPWEPMPSPEVGTLPAAFEFQAAWQLPAATPMLAFTQPLLVRAAQGGVGVMLDGEGGDELFGCSPYLIADRVRAGRLRSALRLLGRLPDQGAGPSRRERWELVAEFALKGAAPHAFHRAVRRIRGSRRYAAPWLTAESAKTYVEVRDEWSWKRRRGPRWWSYLAELLTTWREQMGAYDFFRHRDALAGLETRHPLLDDLDLIERVLRLPPELSFDRQLTRPLERSVVAGVLPDEVRLRPDKSTFSQLVVEALGGPDYALAVDLLQAPDAEIRAYARPAAIDDLLGVPAERRSIAWARLVWRLTTTESWLRSQADPELPARLLERLRQGASDGRPAPRGPRRARTS